MKGLAAAALLAAGCASGPPVPGPDLVEIRGVDPTILLDIRYATDKNFTGKQVYPVASCYLKKKVAGRLSKVQGDLREKGLGLKVFDCYRPLSVQKRFWELVPDERYVANPAKGSRHNRGFAVDLTLVDGEGRELEMPTAYDDFSEKAHRDAPASAAAAANRERLAKAMTRRGFEGLRTEWWHFDLPGWKDEPLLDVPFESLEPSR